MTKTSVREEFLASFSIHFDGGITDQHRVSVRVLGNTYQHMQRAIDRAFLVEKYGAVEKHEKLTKLEYRETEFLALYPREGGIYLDAVRAGAERIIDRIYAATSVVFGSAVAQAFEQHQSMAQQLVASKDYSYRMGERVRPFSEVLDNPPAVWSAAYSNRSIVKEIDQLVAQITRPDLAESSVELTLHGTRAQLPLVFTPAIARSFHKIAADRELGPPMIVRARIRLLDAGNRITKPNAKVLNLDTQKEVNLYLSGTVDFDALHPYHNIDGEVRIHVCPILEAKGFDVRGGDLMFLRVA